MTPLELEGAIKGLVESEFGGELPVSAFPDDLESYRMLGSAEILLGYRGGPFEPPQHGTKAQMRSVAFELVVMSRSMSGHGGAVAILDRLRLALQGRKLQGAVFPIRIVADRYLGRAAGQWWYSLEILAAGIPAFAKPEPESPPLRHITARDATTNEPMEVKA